MGHPHELITDRALGVHNPADETPLDMHLAECADCRAFAADVADVTTALAFMAPYVEAPAGMRERVLKAALPARTDGAADAPAGVRERGLEVESATPAPTDGAPRASSNRRGRSAHNWRGRYLRPRILAPVATAFAIGVAVAAVSLHHWSAGGTAHPTGHLVSLGAIGNATVWADGTVAIDTAATPPVGRVYEAWLLRDGHALPDGLLPRRGGELVTRLPAHSGDAIAITAEPLSGSHTVATSAPLVTAGV